MNSNIYLQRLKERLKKYDFVYKYLQKQLNAAKSLTDVFSQGNNQANLEMANKLVNTLTMQLSEREQQIIDLKAEVQKLTLDLNGTPRKSQ